MKLHEQIKDARVLARLTQKQMAESVGVKQNTYSDLERGKSNNFKLLLKVAEVLNFDIILTKKS